MLKEKRIIVIAPSFNEEPKICEVVRRVGAMRQQIVDEMLVVDDGSTDQSAMAARALGATVLELKRRCGVGAAIRAGLEYARECHFDICVIIAGNNKDEPNEIPQLVAAIADGQFDFVQGSRYLNGDRGRNMPLYRKLATRLHPWLFSLCVGKRLTESTNGFRAIRLTLLDDPQINLRQEWLDAYELEPYLLFKAIKLGYRHVEIPCTKTYPPKALGQTKMKPIISWWSILRPLLYLKLGLRR